MDHASFQAWLDRYIDAWRSSDASAVGNLFSANARYFFGPYGDQVVGRDAIVANWMTDPDAPGSWEAEYRPLAIDGAVEDAVFAELEALGPGPRAAVEHHARLRASHDLDVAPGERARDAEAEGFPDGLLAGEPPGVGLRRVLT